MKSKKIIIVISIVVAILVALGGTFAGLWFFTDVFNFLKPANEVFSNQMEKAFNVEGAKFANYSDFLKEYKEMSDKSVKTTINMKANLKISELDSEVQDVINKSKITMESSVDVKNNRTQSKFGLYASNSEVLTLDLVSNDDKIGVGCKDIYDKYVTISKDDLLDVMKKNSSLSKNELEMVSKTFSGSNIDPYELLYISESDLKHFDDTYRDCLKTLISKDCYSSKKKVEVKVDGKRVETTAYYLTLTGKDAYDFLSKLTELIKDDDVVARIATDKINMILESIGQDKISEKDVKDLLSEVYDSLDSELESLKDETDSAIQIAVYSDKTNPVRIELNVIDDVDDLDNKETVLSIEYAKSKTIYTIYNRGKAYGTLVNEYSKNSKEEKVGKMEVEVAGQSVGTLDYELVNKEKETKIDLSLNVPVANLSADIEFSSQGNYQKEPVSFNGLVNFKYGKESAKVEFDGSVEYGDVSVPELTSKNSINVFKLSEKELNAELEKGLTKASKILPARLKLIGINIKAEDILPLMWLNLH